MRLKPPANAGSVAWMFAIVALATLSGCVPDNVSACNDYVVAADIARRDCGVVDENGALEVLDPEVYCPASLNNGADCTDHYERLAQNVTCEGGNGGEVTGFSGVKGGPYVDGGPILPIDYRTEGCF